MRFPLLCLLAASLTYGQGAVSREFLGYDVSWGSMVVGHARIETIPTTSPSQFLVRTTAKANNTIQSWYPVLDTVDSYIETATGLPIEFRKRINEGSYSASFKIAFDRRALSAKVSGFSKGKPKPDTSLTITPNVHDILSAFHAIRNQPLEPKKSAYIAILDNRKLFEKVEIQCIRKETLKTEYGTWKTLVIEPKLHGDALFQSKGKLTIWLTDDERRMPVRMVSKIKLGSITADLTTHSP